MRKPASSGDLSQKALNEIGRIFGDFNIITAQDLNTFELEQQQRNPSQMWIPSSSHNYVFKNPEHLLLRGLGFLSIIAHILTSLQCGLSMVSGESSSFKNSQAALNMFYLKLAVFIITIVSLILLAFHFFSLSCTNLARLSGLLIFIALCVHMISKQYLRSLSYDKGELAIHANENTNTTGEITPIENCSRQYSALWPTESLELYSKAQKVVCTEVCPCSADSETKGAINYQDCLKLSGSIEQFHFKKVLKQLMTIEKEIQCSGVCMQLDKFYFSDSRVAPLKDQKYPNCFEKGLKLMEKQLISGETGNHAFDLLLLTISLNILSEIIRHVHLRHFWQKIKRICPQKNTNNPSLRSNTHDFKIFSDESIESEDQQQNKPIHPNNIVHLIDVNLLNSMNKNHDDHDHDHDHSVHATPIITKPTGPQTAEDEHFQDLNH